MFINMDTQSNKLITIKQAAKILGVTPLTLRNWDNSGKFEASRHPINNYRVYKLSDIEKLLMEIETSKGKRPTKTEVRKLVVKHLND
jgi:DNA-binding transcriptional MerR regulator